MRAPAVAVAMLPGTGATNPIWIDVDGNGWTPPRLPLPRRAASGAPPPDIRTRFDALPEISR